MHGMLNKHQYARCLVLAGGGFRFGYHLGIHAAAEETGKAPDLLLASCGGAVAATAIQRLPDAAARKEWLASREMYEFFASLRSTSRAAPLPMLAGATRRWLGRAAAPVIPDLFDDHLFSLPTTLPLPPPAAVPHDGPDVAIVGARLLFGRRDIGLPRGGRALYAETVFGNERVAALLAGMAGPVADQRWSGGAISTRLELDTAMPVEDVVRISLADMVYFRCHQYCRDYYTGGVVDLYPVELARRLATHVTMERKPEPDAWLVAPAWRSVLGIDGAARLRHVHAQPADVWLDTLDMALALRGQGIAKAFRWRENRLRLVAPATYAAYQAQVDAQWQYGYRKGLDAFAQQGVPCAS
jgi:hypothetical protein